MDLQKPISITKLNIKGQNVYIRYFWEEDKHFLFRMKLFDGKNSWSGRFSSDFADNIDEPVEDYNRNVKEALLNGSLREVVLNVKALGDFLAELGWLE